jgi:hypothetical protein
MPMTARLRQKCISITEKLITLPCAACFIEPIDPNDPQEPDPALAREYFSVINCPVDLTSILGRLRRCEYDTVDTWDHDVSLVWYNAEKFSGRNSYVFVLAQELCRQYTKLRKPFEWESLRGWTERWVGLEKRMGDLLAAPPKVAKSHFASHGRAVAQEPFAEENFAPLAQALKKLRRPGDVMYIKNVLMRHMGRLSLSDDAPRIDLRALPPAGLRALQQHAQRRFAESGWQYPAPEPSVRSK